MEPWLKTAGATLYHGDCMEVLRTLPDNSVQCCVTSPPYWALRDYQTATWVGGDIACDHRSARLSDSRQEDRQALGDSHATHKSQLVAHGRRVHCERCGAIKEDRQIGLEATPEEYIAKMVSLFREVRRVLREDGTFWLNIGDTYSVGRGASHSYDPIDGKNARKKFTCRPNDRALPGLKKKDLIGIPWMLAFALRADGWYLRSEIIWSKRSPMPESTRDRPTKSHEQLFLLTKAPKYFYDSVNSQEPAATGNPRNSRFDVGKSLSRQPRPSHKPREDSATRNMRSVWTLSNSPLKAAHFAAYPPELVRKCLSAGVSENGCCALCGKPMERVTEKRRSPTRSGATSKISRASRLGGSPYGQQSGIIVGNRDPRRHCTETLTVGWRHACNCEVDEFNEHLKPRPCVVLDPFHGAGTTWKVCERLGVEYIGIELNEEYLRLSVERQAVTFPHERRQRRAKASTDATAQMLLPLE